MVTENSHYWEKLGFFGGHVFLDFINTVDDIEKTRYQEGIESWHVLIRWALATGVINQAEASELKKHRSKKTAQTELKCLHNLRELAWRTLSAMAADCTPSTQDLSKLGDEIRWAHTQAKLVQSNGGLQWEVVARPSDLTLVRARLGLLAGHLLSSSPLKINECGSCTGLFLNKGRGVGRKWCRMQSCGNRAKVNKFRAR